MKEKEWKDINILIDAIEDRIWTVHSMISAYRNRAHVRELMDVLDLTNKLWFKLLGEVEK